MPSRPKPSRSGAPPSATVRTAPVAPPHAVRPLTSAELQLASDLELARGNRRRGELLSWKAHQVRCEVPA